MRRRAGAPERGRQPIYSAIAIETGLALRLVFNQPLRKPKVRFIRSPVALAASTRLQSREPGRDRDILLQNHRRRAPSVLDSAQAR
jgi:hypothetical protein